MFSEVDGRALGIRKICDYMQSAIALCVFLSIINIEMCDFYSDQYIEMCKFLHVDSAEKCGGALCYTGRSSRILKAT